MGEEGSNTIEMLFETLTSQVLLFLGCDSLQMPFSDVLSRRKQNPVTKQNIQAWTIKQRLLSPMFLCSPFHICPIPSVDNLFPGLCPLQFHVLDPKPWDGCISFTKHVSVLVTENKTGQASRRFC